MWLQKVVCNDEVDYEEFGYCYVFGSMDAFRYCGV